MALVPALARIELAGIRFDPLSIRAARRAIDRRIAAIEAAGAALARRDFKWCAYLPPYPW